MIEFHGAFYLLKDADNPHAQPLDIEAGMEALAEAGGFELTAGTREAFEQLLLEVGRQIKKTIVEEVTRGIEPEPVPLADSTVARKGHAGWLYDMGEFVNNLQPILVVGGPAAPGGIAGVGLSPEGSASHDERLQSWQLAYVLTHGAVVRITDPVVARRMIAYLRREGIPPKDKDPFEDESKTDAIITIYIPPRRLLPAMLEDITNRQATSIMQRYFQKRIELAAHTLNTRPWNRYLVHEIKAQAPRVIELIRGTGPF